MSTRTVDRPTRRSLPTVAVLAAVTVVLVSPWHLEMPVIWLLRALIPTVQGRGDSHLLFWAAEDIMNVLLFVPVGLVLANEAAAKGIGGWWLGAVAGMVLSALGETVQLFIPGRVSSIGDVALNSVGALLGALLALLVGLRARASARSPVVRPATA